MSEVLYEYKCVVPMASESPGLYQFDNFTFKLTDEARAWSLDNLLLTPEVRFYCNRKEPFRIWLRFANIEDATLFKLKFSA